MRSWVDALYVIHNDRKSHTGGAISFGRGVLMPKSKKQKLNTKSSTEAEVVGISDYLGEIIWTRMFIECQGYAIEKKSFIKIMKVLSRSQKTENYHAENNRNILTYVISLSKIV